MSQQLWIEDATTHELVCVVPLCPNGCINPWTHEPQHVWQYQNAYWLTCFICHGVWRMPSVK